MFRKLIWLVFILIFMSSGYVYTSIALYCISFFVLFVMNAEFITNINKNNKTVINEYLAIYGYDVYTQKLHLICSNLIHLFFVFTLLHNIWLCLIIILLTYNRVITSIKLEKEYEKCQK